METILSAGLGIGVLMFLLLLFKKGKKQEDYFFLSWIAVMLGQIAFYNITVYQFELTGFVAIFTFALPLLGAPLLFFYILSLTGHTVTLKIIASHVIIYALYVLLFLFLKEHDDITLIVSNGFFQMTENSPQWMQYYAIPLAISGLVYCIWDLLLLKKHRKNIADLFSYEEKVNLRWVNYIVYSYFILFVLASFLIFGSAQFQLFPMEDAFALVGITLSLMLIAFAFYGFRQTAIFSNSDMQTISGFDLEAAKSEKASYSKSGLTPEKIKNLANHLTEYVKIEKPFLNEDLNLALLAEQSGIPQSHLSQLINQHFKMNFYDFINRHRVEEAKKKLVSSNFNHLSVLGIAFDCGFKSKSSFNRYFKKYSGISPSEYKKKNSDRFQPMG